INCAHDDEPAWRAMAAHLRAANTELHTSCRVQLDLPGPKLRTGSFRPGPRVIHVRPQRDALGNVVAPGRLRLQAAGAARSTGPPTAPPREWVAALAGGRCVSVRDHRGRSRGLHVVERDASGAWVTSVQSAYVSEDPELRLETRAGRGLAR